MCGCFVNIFCPKNNKGEEVSELLPKKEEYPIYDHKSKHNKTEFEIGKQIGEGGFGCVYLCRKIDNNKNYAIKVIKKNKIDSDKMRQDSLNEKIIMSKINNNPFVVKLEYAFQDNARLYLVMEYVEGGGFTDFLNREGIIDEKTTKIYLIELIIALEYLHKNKIIYLDLKPENILLTSQGHIKLTDFGLSKELNDQNKKPYETVGTPKYTAPEVSISGREYDFSSDWWSLGILIYKMLTGNEPISTFPRLLNEEFYENEIKKINVSNASEEMNDLLKKLLVVDPSKRLGYNGAEEIKSHPFFKGINWIDSVNEKLGLNPPIPKENGSLNKTFSFNELENDDNEPPEGRGEYIEGFSF